MRTTADSRSITIPLSGRYALQRETLDFRGSLFMDARLSETTSGWKSWALKIVDPVFRRDGRTVVPITIGGSRSDPKFGVDVKGIINKEW